MRGWGEVNGAVSLVSAIPSGRGATLAVSLRTSARVALTRGLRRGWKAFVNGRRAVGSLTVEAAKECILSCGLDPSLFSGVIETFSEAPQGVGLKTSSSSTLAVALATAAALGSRRYDESRILMCSVVSSLRSGKSVTGAIDDAASCLLGGVNMTDNRTNKVVRSVRLGRRLAVLICVPSRRSRRGSLDLSEARRLADVSEHLFQECMRGSYWKAMTINGFVTCSLLGYSCLEAVRAIEMGALGAGVTGTGPAVAAVFDGEPPEELEREWLSRGSAVIRTATTDCRGRLGRID
jgi:shikimate kinase